MERTYSSSMSGNFLAMLTLLFAPIYLLLATYNAGSLMNYLALGVMSILVVLSVHKGIEMVYRGSAINNNAKLFAIIGLVTCICLCMYYGIMKDVSMVCSLLILGTMPLVLSITSK